MRFFTVSASAALLMLGTAAASAQTAQTAPDAYDDAQDQTAATQRFLDRTFGNIDENRDGTIDRPEWDAFMTDWLAERRERFDSRFKEAGTNGDGYLDRNEADRNEPILAQRFTTIDVDGDGYHTPRELRPEMRKRPHDTRGTGREAWWERVGQH